jgi:hypothetical protein
MPHHWHDGLAREKPDHILNPIKPSMDRHIKTRIQPRDQFEQYSIDSL